MNHSIIAENYAVRLRPVRMEDAPFIVWLRNLEHVRGWVGDSATDIATQEAWLAAYFEREKDYYFIIETICGTPVGTQSIYGITDEGAESGRWAVWPEVHAALPSLVVAFDLAFGQLGIRQLWMNIVSTNRICRLCHKLGLNYSHNKPAAQIIDGSPVDFEHFTLNAEDWPDCRKKLGPRAQMAESQIRSWELSNAYHPHPRAIPFSTYSNRETFF